MVKFAKFLRNILALVGFLSLPFWFLSLFVSNEHRCRSAEEILVLSQLASIGSATQLYYEDNGYYPKDISDLVGNYLKTELIGPWGNSYKFQEEENRFVIFTKNPKKKHGKFVYRIEYGI